MPKPRTDCIVFCTSTLRRGTASLRLVTLTALWFPAGTLWPARTAGSFQTCTERLNAATGEWQGEPVNAAFVRLRQPYRPVAGSDRLRLAYIGKAQNSIHLELGEAFPKPTNPPSSMYLPRQKTRGDKSGFGLCLAAPLVSFEVFTQGIARSAPPHSPEPVLHDRRQLPGKFGPRCF